MRARSRIWLIPFTVLLVLGIVSLAGGLAMLVLSGKSVAVNDGEDLKGDLAIARSVAVSSVDAGARILVDDAVVDAVDVARVVQVTQSGADSAIMVLVPATDALVNIQANEQISGKADLVLVTMAGMGWLAAILKPILLIVAGLLLTLGSLFALHRWRQRPRAQAPVASVPTMAEEDVITPQAANLSAPIAVDSAPAEGAFFSALSLPDGYLTAEERGDAIAALEAEPTYEPIAVSPAVVAAEPAIATAVAAHGSEASAFAFDPVVFEAAQGIYAPEPVDEVADTPEPASAPMEYEPAAGAASTEEDLAAMMAELEDAAPVLHTSQELGPQNSAGTWRDPEPAPALPKNFFSTNPKNGDADVTPHSGFSLAESPTWAGPAEPAPAAAIWSDPTEPVYTWTATPPVVDDWSDSPITEQSVPERSAAPMTRWVAPDPVASPARPACDHVGIAWPIKAGMRAAGMAAPLYAGVTDIHRGASITRIADDEFESRRRRGAHAAGSSAAHAYEPAGLAYGPGDELPSRRSLRSRVA